MKKEIRAVLEGILENDRIISPAWPPQGARWSMIHGVGTSQLGGYKLGCLYTSGGEYGVGVFTTANMTIIGDPWVKAFWPSNPPDSTATIVKALLEVYDLHLIM